MSVVHSGPAGLPQYEVAVPVLASESHTELRKAFLPCNGFLSSWHFYYPLWVQRREVEHPTSTSVPIEAETHIEQALRDFAAKQAAKADIVVSGVRKAAPSLSEQARANVQTWLRRHDKEKEDETLLSVRYLFYYDEKANLKEYLQLDLAKKYVQMTRIIFERFTNDQTLDGCLAILSQLARHPAMAFLSQCAVDEVVSVQADGFVHREEEEKGNPLDNYISFMEMPAFIFWLYLESHKPEAKQTQGDGIEEWKIWHLFSMARAAPSAPVLLGLTPDDSGPELRKLMTDTASAKVFEPLVTLAIYRRMKVYGANDVSIVQSMIQSLCRFSRKSLPQLARAFPPLVWSNSVINIPNAANLHVVCNHCNKKKHQGDMNPRLVPSYPDTGDDFVNTHYGGSYCFQWELWNRTRVKRIVGEKCSNCGGEYFRVRHMFYNFPRFLILKSKYPIADEEIAAGPCAETGRMSYYRLYSRVEVDGGLHKAERVKASPQDWALKTLDQFHGKMEVHIYERIDPAIDSLASK